MQAPKYQDMVKRLKFGKTQDHLLGQELEVEIRLEVWLLKKVKGGEN